MTSTECLLLLKRNPFALLLSSSHQQPVSPNILLIYISNYLSLLSICSMFMIKLQLQHPYKIPLSSAESLVFGI